MLAKKYIEKIKKQIDRFANKSKAKVFIFGSSLTREKFGDVDIGLLGDGAEAASKIKAGFEDSTFPYFVDVVNFNKVSKEFRDNVFNNKILWIKN
jgi:predicted nucleotidyltransferase